MNDILLSIVAYAVVAILCKSGSRGEQNITAVNLFVFMGGTLTALALGFLTGGLSWGRSGSLLGCGAGVASVMANITILLAMRFGRMAVSWTVFNLGLAVPIVLAVPLWGESLAWRSGAGLVATAVAIGLLGKDMADRNRQAAWAGSARNGGLWGFLIAAAFLANGTVMTFNKAFEEGGGTTSRFGYLSAYFGTGLAASVLLYLWKRPSCRGSDGVVGLGIGAASVFGAFFLLRALSRSGAVLVFPSVSAGSLAAVALLSVVLFRERLSWKGWAGVAVGIVAVVLMKG